VTDYIAGRAGFMQQMNEWISTGDVKGQDTVEVGIERAPAAFLKLFSGGNIGKMLVRL
jgi:NADPH-dependent curcumin reductase CurA